MDTLHLHPHIANITYFIAVIFAAGIFAVKVSRQSDFDSFPTVGPSSWLGALCTGFKFLRNDVDVLREGYAKYKQRPFKIADGYRWLIIVSSREHMEELRSATENQLSVHETVRARLAGDSMIGKHNLINPYHVPIVRSHLSRHTGSLCSEMKDEIVTTFDEVLNLTRDEWRSVAVLNVIQKVVFKTSNRFIVGLPLSRNPDWMDFNIQNAMHIVSGSNFLRHFPLIFQPLVSLLIPNITQATERGMEFLAPIVAERQKRLNEYGNTWADKPNDFLSWLMDVAEGEERTARHLTSRIMFLNFASIHPVSQVFTHALVYLAANPQYINPLREEVETTIEREGWSKAALDRMIKVDSLLKETQRLKGSLTATLTRMAMIDFTFSDGTFIPKGAMVSAPTECLHLDDELYENANVFDPFRFARLREVEGEETKHQYVSTSLKYLPFGHGSHACPGRFFAASIMKAMLAYVVLSYDMKLEDGATVPQDIRIGTTISVDPKAKVMFRGRKVES